jgi:hypothetical protein
MHRRSFLSLAATPLLAQPPRLELFLLAGQSNMAGRGVAEEEDKKPIPGIWSLNKALEWVPAVDPLHFDKPIAAVGLGRSFARTLRAARPSAEIGLIPCAMGGSALEEWEPGTPNREAAMARMKAARTRGQLRGILWHQGEADSGTDVRAQTYGVRLRRFIGRFRDDLEAPDLPFVLGQLGTFFAAPFSKGVDNQIAMVPNWVPRTAFVPSDGLVHKGDSVHFDTPSLREFGRRYAHAYMMIDSKW